MGMRVGIMSRDRDRGVVNDYLFNVVWLASGHVLFA